MTANETEVPTDSGLGNDGTGGTRVAELLDRLEIEQVIFGLANAIDRQDWEAVTLWTTPDLHSEMIVEGVVAAVTDGRDTLITSGNMMQEMGLVATQHLYPSVSVTIAGDAASSRMVGTVTNVWRDRGPVTAGVHADGEYRRTTGGWKRCSIIGRYLWGGDQFAALAGGG